MENKDDEERSTIQESKNIELSPMQMVQTTIPNTILVFSQDQTSAQFPEPDQRNKEPKKDSE
jgi:hypothetical protein